MMGDILDSSNTYEILNSDLREDTWADLGDDNVLRYDLIKDRQIGEDLCISLSKMGVDCMKLQLRNSFLTPLQSEQTLPHIPLKDSVETVRFIINTRERNKFISKLIRLKEQDVNRMLVLTCDLKDADITIKIIEMNSSELIHGDEGLKQLKPRVLY